MGSKRARLEEEEEEEDRISGLPDAIIHHILSFLPSTRAAVLTGILSKRWLNQWTRVPVLRLKHLGMSEDKFLKFMEHVLIRHDCSKIKKLLLEYPYSSKPDPQLPAKFHFVARKNVEELYLSHIQGYPPVFFQLASLLKLRAYNSTLTPYGKVNWGCLTELILISCKLSDQAMEQIISGSPSLKSLQLSLSSIGKLTIASKSLEILSLHSFSMSAIDISCPSLLKLFLSNISMIDDSQSLARALENLMSENSLLDTIEIILCSFRKLSKLVIASTSLKKLVLQELNVSGALEISCPKLEKLQLSSFLIFQTAKLLNFPSSVFATINFDHYLGTHDLGCLNDILQSLKYVKQLELGRSFIRMLSLFTRTGAGIFVPILNTECLTLAPYNLTDWHHGITHVLAKSPMLQKLVIKVTQTYDAYKNKICQENYWSLDEPVFSCLVSHIKTIEIIGFPLDAHSRKLLLSFVKFLLKNASLGKDNR